MSMNNYLVFIHLCKEPNQITMKVLIKTLMLLAFAGVLNSCTEYDDLPEPEFPTPPGLEKQSD